MGTFSIESLPHKGSTAPGCWKGKRGQSYNYKVILPSQYQGVVQWLHSVAWCGLVREGRGGQVAHCPRSTRERTQQPWPDASSSAASPVYGTVEGKWEVVVKLLLDAGADTEAEDEKGTLFLLRDGR